MRPGVALLSLLSLLLVCLLPGGDARAGWGSEALLRALWTPRELAGSAAEHVVTRPYTQPPDLSPPVRMTPDYPLPAVPDSLRGVIRRVRVTSGDKVLALTFDLCERASNRTGYRTEIANFLRRRAVPATFFAGGKWMRSHPEQTMQLMADPLFELGNHSWTHANFALLDEEETRDQVLWTQCQFEILRGELLRRARALGLEGEMGHVPRAMTVFRLPYGRSSTAALERLAAMGLPAIQWDVLGEGGSGGPAEIARRVATQVRPGSIVLLHANAVPKSTQDIVPLLVDTLLAQGWRFVTVSELLTMGDVESVADGYFETPGDNQQFDSGYPGKGTLHPRPVAP